MKTKNKFYSDQLDEVKDDPKKLWRVVNTTLHRTSESKLPSASSSKSLADKFSDFFINKIKSIRDSFPPVSTSPNFSKTNAPLLSKFSKVTESELKKIMNSSPKKSCSLDPWPTFLVLEYIDILITPITNIINFSLSEGIFPETFKNAIVLPLLKKPSLDKEILKNYRPVSNLNYVSKVLEKVVAGQLKKHMQLNNLTNIFQSAYKSGHSTETALLKVQTDILTSLSKGQAAALVLLDLSAAFDTIDHSTLLGRLFSSFGISEICLDWFKSYLTGRTQCVSIVDALSCKAHLDFGVPQGSVLGPLLFTLYTSDLSKIITGSNCRYHLYADDTQVYIELKSNTANHAIKSLQECLLKIKDWMTLNLLKLNPDKTEFIIVGNKNIRSKLSNLFPVDILGEQITPISSVRNLGVVFDSDFCFSKHVSQLCGTCFYYIKDFKRIRPHLNLSIAKTIATALISSRLDYCNSLLSCLKGKDLDRLSRIQKILCRIVTKIPSRSSISTAMKKLHWLPLKYRIDFKMNLLTFKALNSGFPAYLKEYLTPFKSIKNTRRCNPDLNYLLEPHVIPRQHTSPSYFQSSYAYLAPRLWNSLPVDARSAVSVFSFRRKLKHYYFKLAYPP